MRFFVKSQPVISATLQHKCFVFIWIWGEESCCPWWWEQRLELGLGWQKRLSLRPGADAEGTTESAARLNCRQCTRVALEKQNEATA